MLINIQNTSESQSDKPSLKALFSLGFRPLYLSAAIWTIVSIILWIYVPASLKGPMTASYWHAHEMLWGFVITIAVAFLLTASATWTGRTPAQGSILMYIVLLWWISRILLVVPSIIAFKIGMITEFSFFALSAYRLWSVLWSTKNKRNYILPFVLLILAFLDLGYLYSVLEGDYLGVSRYVDFGFIGMAYIALLIARRVLPFFASRGASIEIPNHQKSGSMQLSLMVITFMASLLDLHIIAALCLIATGIISIYQLLQWKPHKVIHIPLLWVLYISYFFLGVGLIFSGIYFLLSPSYVALIEGWGSQNDLTFMLSKPAFHLHIIGMGGFAVMIIGMITRTSLGHTGQALRADKWMVWMYICVLIAFVIRMAGLYPSNVIIAFWHTSALFWIIAFGLFLYRFTPLLTKPRADRFHPKK
ncbi:NnrS family protein [Taylorella equigenitalis]|uniref:NnrS family protein n=1 Tax=Taylorella equigenitalis TaxID=29575 RepID=UPI0004234BC2|nr:NnrS family protein [Taylorella equigenitalis]WDU53966.1 NnrS family protein [Taylorella equigenitalis]